MSTKTITITKRHTNGSAAERARTRASPSYSPEFPFKRKLSEILAEIGKDDELAHRIDAASKEMRRAQMLNAKI